MSENFTNEELIQMVNSLKKNGYPELAKKVEGFIETLWVGWRSDSGKHEILVETYHDFNKALYALGVKYFQMFGKHPSIIFTNDTKAHIERIINERGGVVLNEDVEEETDD